MSLIAADTHYCVVGLGVTGLSCVRYLSAHGKSVSVVDSRFVPPGLSDLQRDYPEVPFLGGEFNVDVLTRATHLVMSPGVPLATPAIQQAIAAGVRITSDIELFLSQFNGKVIAITGSNAKSTVTRWLGDALINGGYKTLVGGNIGNAVLDCVDQDYDIAVLELSSFQLELLKNTSADVATILNLSEDHMDRYANMASYQQAKQRIYFGTRFALYNRQDILTQPLVPAHVTVRSFGLNEPDLKDYGIRVVNGKEYLAHGLKNLMPISEISLPGYHNVINALAVLAMADAVGNSREATLATLTQFAGLPHRCQRVAEQDGVVYYNDSKATNIGSTLAALNGLASAPANIHLLLGGQGKGQDFSPLIQACEQHCKSVTCYGEDGEALHQLIAGSRIVASLEQALRVAQTQAVSGDIILLSPACASFDQFDNFEHRGRCFVEWVGGAQ